MSSKQILIYGRIDSYKAQEFNASLSEIEEGDDVLLRVNTEGGSPEYAWGMIAMFKDLPNSKKIKVDGQAHSMGAFLLCYVEESEALDVSEFLIHRASYGEWFESSTYFTESIKENLINVNKSLEKAFRAKVDIDAFEALPKMEGKTTKDIFSMDSRIDIFLTAKEAKKIGLISKIIPLTSTAAAEITSYAKAASSGSKMFIPSVKKEEEKPIIQNQNLNKMTAAEFKAANPEAYASIQNEAILGERDRVGSLMAFHDLDPETISKAIKEGGALTATMSAELTRKAIAKTAVKEIEDESAVDVTVTDKTGETAKTEASKKTEDFLAEATKLAKAQIV